MYQDTNHHKLVEMDNSIKQQKVKHQNMKENCGMTQKNHLKKHGMKSCM